MVFFQGCHFRVKPMKSSDTVRKLFSPIFTLDITFHIFPVAFTVCGHALVTRCHLLLTIQAAHHLWGHWGEDEGCRWREVLHKGGNRSWRVPKDGGASETLLLRGFHFTFFNLDVFPDSLWQGGKVWGRGAWGIRKGSFVSTWGAWQSWCSL